MAATQPEARASRRMSAGQRRESILAAAAEEFTEAGYQRARMARVAERLGVTEPVVFQNFGSKPALYAAVLDRAADEMCDLLATEAAKAVSVAEFLAGVLSPGHLDRMHRRGNPGVLFADAVGLTSDPEIAETARRSVRKVARVLTKLFEQGQQAGDVADDTEAATLAWWLLSFFASHGFRCAVMPHRPQREADLAQLTLQMLTVIDPDGA